MPKGVFLLLLLLAGAAAAADERYLGYAGIATARGSAKLLYTERHVLLYRDGRLAERVVLYTCPHGAAFARKTVHYVDLLAPDFALEDLSDGMREGVRSGAGIRTVYFRAGAGEQEQSAALPPVAGLVVDAGFDDFVRGHWTALMAGQPSKMPFLLPSRLNTLVFQVQHVRSGVLGNEPSEVFRLRVAGVLGWVLPGIEVTYGAVDQLMLRYTGLSDLRDAGGDNLDVQIDFPAADRAPSDAQAMTAALEAPLSPCQ